MARATQAVIPPLFLSEFPGLVDDHKETTTSQGGFFKYLKKICRRIRDVALWSGSKWRWSALALWFLRDPTLGFIYSFPLKIIMRDIKLEPGFHPFLIYISRESN